jgi:hypothetical protein
MKETEREARAGDLVNNRVRRGENDLKQRGSKTETTEGGEQRDWTLENREISHE